MTFSDFGEKIPFWSFWPFLVKIWPFWTKNGLLGTFLPNGSWDLPEFCYGNCQNVLLLQLPSVYAGKNLVLPNLAIFWSKFCHFGPKIAFWAHFSQTGHDICPIFAMETVIMFYYYNYLVYMLAKIWFGQIWPFFFQNLAIFAPFHPNGSWDLPYFRYGNYHNVLLL